MGEKWLPVTLVIQVLACVFSLQTLTNPIQPLALALGETRKLFQRDLWIFLVRIPLVLVGLWLAGLSGIIYARVISGILGIVMNLQLADRLVGVPIRVQLLGNSRSLLSLAVMIVTVISVRGQMTSAGNTADLIVTLAALVAFGAVAYVGTHLLLWVAARRPSGPESQLQELLVSVFHKLSKRQSA